MATPILKYILHDWNDEECVQILRNCRRASKSPTVLVIERLVKPPNQPDPAKWLDLHMLVMLTGRERTEAEFSALFDDAGFRLARVFPAGEHSILEGISKVQ